MKTSRVWNDQVPEKDGVKSPINDVAYSPDGTKVVVAVGNRVLLYNAESGDLIESLRGHKDTVYSVDFSFDGNRFASGGADNIVVIWKSTGQGMLKYNHTASIQRVVYNPSTLQLASCSEVDFGMWTPDQKQVTKEKTQSKITSAAWASDGSIFAIGMQSGLISIRNSQTDETHRIERRAPVWCLAFLPNPVISSKLVPPVGVPESETLVVGCWDKTVSFYKMQGTSHRVQGERKLSYYPCGVALAGQNKNKGNYMIVCGSNKKALLYSRDGLRLAEVVSKEAWVWACASHPPSDRVVVGCDDGSIEMLQIAFDAVHALYKDRYAYRDSLTEVVVHHLVTDKKVRIKCRDLVQRLSLYKNKLAVQLSDKVCIYESDAEDTLDLHFRLRRERILRDIPCELMIMLSTSLLFCQRKAMHMHAFDGQRLRTWSMQSSIKYVKVDGGPEGREAILVGLDSGHVMKVFADNPFPLDLTKGSIAVVSADLSMRRDMVVVVDSEKRLSVTDLKTQEVLFTAQGALSACFNSEVEDMMCYTAESSIFVLSGLSKKRDKAKSGSPPDPLEQHIAGIAMGFHGQRIFCLHKGTITSVDVPQGANIQRFLDLGDMASAYYAACLGATEAEWRLLAMRSLRANNLTVAKNSFARLKDYKFLNLIESLERSGDSGRTGGGPGTSRRGAQSKSNPVLDPAVQAELLAYEGDHLEAAKVYARAGNVQEAIRLLVDLRRWNDAKIFAQNAEGKDGESEKNNLTMQQAKWLHEVNDWKGAAEIYISLGQYMQAAQMVVDSREKERDEESGWQNMIIEVVRAAPKDQTEVLSFCGEVLTSADEDVLARETYAKLGDVSKLMTLYVRKQMFAEAAKLAEENEGKFDLSVYLPYAEWLVLQDRYEDAIQAFKKAARYDLARKVLEELTHNAVIESRFKDAAYFYWLLSSETVDKEDDILQTSYELHADLYFAYANIHAYVVDPFTTHLPETLFQVSRFILNSLGSTESIPYGISKANTLYTLAKQAMCLGAFKLARQTYERLGLLQVPARKLEEVEHDMLVVQAKQMKDDPDHLPVCYRCGATNPLLNPFTSKFTKGDICTNCGHPFIRSFVNFDILPLVEFIPDRDISDEEAVELIRQPAGNGNRGRRGSAAAGDRGPSGGWKEGKVGESEMMTFDQSEGDDMEQGAFGGMGDDGEDLFSNCLNRALEGQSGSSRYMAVMVDVNTLISLKRSEIFICKPDVASKNKRATFYRNMLPDIAIALSQPCRRFFHLEDFEFAYLSNQSCPYSRIKDIGEYGTL